MTPVASLPTRRLRQLRLDTEPARRSLIETARSPRRARPGSTDSGGASRPDRRRHPRFPASIGALPDGAPGIAPGSAPDPEASTVDRWTQAPCSDGSRLTLEQSLASVWEGLLAVGAADCLVCGAQMERRDGSGVCHGCGTRIS